MAVQKLAVPPGGFVPACVLHKTVIGPQVHGHGLATVRAAGNEFRGNAHLQRAIRFHQTSVRRNAVPLRLHHLPHGFFVVKSFRTAGVTALEQPIVPLRIEQPLFDKAGLLEAVVHVGGEHKVVLVLHQTEQLVVHRLRRALVPVDVDIPAPVSPVLFKRIIRVEPAGIHIRKAVFRGKIRKVSAEALAIVHKACRGGKPGPGPDHDGICLGQSLLQLIGL